MMPSIATRAVRREPSEEKAAEGANARQTLRQKNGSIWRSLESGPLVADPPKGKVSGSQPVTVSLRL
jgi:hypothetical protein